MKKIIMLLMSVLFLSGCSTVKNEDELSIVTTLFPQYDITRSIVKDKGNVILLLPPGVEAHSYEPTPQDIVKLNESDLFIYTSDHLETYASKMSSEIRNEDNTVINLESVVEISGEDPHYWLVMDNMVKMTEEILSRIVLVDPENEQFYRDNANEYISNLMIVDAEIKDLLSNTNNETIVFAGHFSFDYFADYYGMNYVTPFESFSPNAEVSPSKISKLIQFIKDNDIEYVYFEELVDPKLAKMLQGETGVELLVLNAEHNVTKEQLEDGTSFISIMRQNIENLKLGLKYEKNN